MQISGLMMNKFSSFKILFQDESDAWFTLNFVIDSYLLQSVGKEGPWAYFEDMFAARSSKKRLWKHRNIYGYDGENKAIRKEMKKSFRHSQEYSNNFNFRRLQMNQKRSDVVYVPIVNDSRREVQRNALEIMS